MITVGANELGGSVGENAVCPNCGEEHVVQYGDKIERDGTLTPSKLIGYVKCSNDKSYLVAVNGMEFRS